VLTEAVLVRIITDRIVAAASVGYQQSPG